MKTREALDILCDPTQLSTLIGLPARAERVRIKPLVSISAAIVVDDTHVADEDVPLAGTRKHRWFRFLWPQSYSKARRADKTAQKLSLRLHEGTCGDLLWQHGALMSDPALGPHINELKKVTPSLGDRNQINVLRHNPFRRIVLRVGEHIVRITATPHDRQLRIHRGIDHRWRTQGKTALPEILSPTTEEATAVHVSIQQRVDGADLSSHPTMKGHKYAGRLLAELHSIDGLCAGEPLLTSGTEQSVHAALAAHVRILAGLDPALAARAHLLVPQVTDLATGDVLVHGDASPDQFLVEEKNERIWITDFDRAQIGPAALDVGSYLYCCDSQDAEHFLDGYSEKATRDLDMREVNTARIHAAIRRLAEPMRNASPTWRSDISCRLDEVEGLLR